MYLSHFKAGPLCPISKSWEPCNLTKVPDGHQAYTLNALWFQEKGAQIHVSEWGQCLALTKMWAKVSSITPHLLHKGLSSSPNRWRSLLSMLCPVRRQVTTLDWVLFKDKNSALAARLGPEISFRACLWVPSRHPHLAQCWLVNQWLSLPLTYLLTYSLTHSFIPWSILCFREMFSICIVEASSFCKMSVTVCQSTLHHISEVVNHPSCNTC
jgi:hypothetical protein